MSRNLKPTERQTRNIQAAIDEDNKLMENRIKALPKNETQVFEMPHIENGVTKIGDLWDCSRSQPTHHNLLKTSQYTSKLLQDSLINKCSMKFNQIRCHEDKIHSLHLDGKMSLEFLLGRIKLEGQLEYENNTSAESCVDGILYNYLNEQYKIQLVPRIRSELLNRDIEKMLHKGDIRATHIVGAIIIGAEVTAWIEVTDTSSKEAVKKEGKGTGGLAKDGVTKVLSSLSLSGSAGVKDSDSTTIINHDVKLSVTARPAAEHSPTSLDEFLSFIRNIPNELTKHTKFTQVNSNIFGVPIRFILYPISQYVDMETETFYRELADTCHNDFVGVIAKCNDLKQTGCIRKTILNRNFHLKFLLDSKSEFSKKVEGYEKEITELARDFLRRSSKALSDYKSGESEIVEIENIVHEFYRSEATWALEKANEMADEGTKELQRAYFNPADDSLQSRVNRLTDRNDCEIWLGKAKPRLLLEIKPPCSEAIVKSFLDAAEHLVKLEVDVAIAMPSISESVCLTLKCNEGREKFEEPFLRNALNVLNAVLVEGDSSIHTFYKILGSISSRKIPLCQDDTNSLDKILITLLKETSCHDRARDVCFVRSVSDLATELNVSLDRMVICLPVGAPDTDLDVVRQFRSLARQDEFSNVKWTICDFKVSDYNEAPLLLIFLQSELIGVCMDNLDSLILINFMNSKSDQNRITFIKKFLGVTPARFATTLYPERAHYTLEITGRINAEKKLSRSKVSGFLEDSYEECLQHLTVIIRATLHNNTVDMASAVAALVTDTFPDLNSTLEKYGWRKAKQNFDKAQFESEDYAANELVNELEEWMNSHSFLVTAEEVQKQLIDLQNGSIEDSDIKFTTDLNRIMNDDHCPSVTKAQLAKVYNQQSLKAKCKLVSDILNIETLKKTVEVGYSHVKALVIVLQKNSQKELLPETIGEELVCLYSSRSSTVTGNAMTKRFLRPYQPYHMLSVLLPVKHVEPLEFLYDSLENLDSLDNSKTVAEIINRVCCKLNQTNSGVLWQNEQWLFLVRHCVNSHDKKELIDSLSKLMTQNSEISLIPADIVETVQRSIATKEVTSVSWKMEIRDDVMGHEYSFQACGEMYHIALGENLKRGYLEEKLLQQFANNLLTGNAIELVKGYSCAIPLAFFRSVCGIVSRIRPDMRVFVINLFELHKSKRTSLLSALFSCKYAASVERHNTRSLLMKMILLEDSVREAYGYDAIIVLNTESLRSQQAITRSHEGNAHADGDWLLTIFAIALSNLTIIDDVVCSGQPTGFERVTEVMTRLRQVGIMPDLLVSRLFKQKISLTEAIDENVDKVNRTSLGAVKSNRDVSTGYANHLGVLTDQLKSRLHNDDIFLDVPSVSKSTAEEFPYACETMHEYVTNLYQSLLSRAESRKHKVTFEYWFQLLLSSSVCLKEQQSYWLCLQEAQYFFELSYFGKKLATAKELLDRTFLFHRRILLKQVKEEKVKVENLSATELGQQLETIPSHCRLECRNCRELVSYREKLYLESKDTTWQDMIRISLQRHRNLVFDSIKKLLEMDCKEFLNIENIAQNVSKQITVELQKINKEHPDGIFNQGEISVHVREIWQRLLTIYIPTECELSEEHNFAQTIDELFPEQENSGFVFYSPMIQFERGQQVDATESEKADVNPASLAKDKSLPLTVPYMIQIVATCQTVAHLLQSQRRDQPRANLNNLHIFKLSNEFEHILSEFLSAKKFDYFQNGMKFEKVMVNEFNGHIVGILRKFEVEFKLPLPDELSRLLQIYFLKKFFDRIMVLQKKWNSNNVAINILPQIESRHKEYISTRLTYGFSSEAEGKLAAKYLVMVIRQTAIKDGHDAKLSSILSIPWIANSETVRLRYFETLAIEVSAGEKERALAHFGNPQTSITKWYNDIVNNYQSKDAQKAYKSTLSKGLLRAVQEIQSCKDFGGLDHLLKRYENYSSSTFKYERFETEDEFESMQKSLDQELQIALNSSSDDIEPIFEISENLEVRFRLGCTEECFRCGALCWNYFGHIDDKSELSKHYACHQARGFAKTPACHYKEILASPCSQTYEEGLITLPGCLGDSYFSWKEVENNHLSDWKFQKHITSKYDELMRWFFQELHIDFAREKKLSCPNVATLKKWGCCDLQLPIILATLRSETN